ncbi:putative nicotianamine synthase 2 [Triticum urartu]|uniref:Nicotianamine synthase n=1 Tax=Triticum urartu TaxID=4572 RepID=M7ZAM0_TRIUA|nr:putative nicotianamine synthase 2 [Triticum urartu]
MHAHLFRQPYSIDGRYIYIPRLARSIAHQASSSISHSPLHSTKQEEENGCPEQQGGGCPGGEDHRAPLRHRQAAVAQPMPGRRRALHRAGHGLRSPEPRGRDQARPEAQKMREGLIRLCSEAEGKLEAHYSDMLAAFDNPLDHLGMFPYYSNYINLSKLEYELLARYVPGGIAPARVAFIGSGPLPFSSFVLAARHLPNTMFGNYDLCGAANDRASKLFRADKDMGARMSFHTADVADLAGGSLHTTWSSWPRSSAWPPRTRPSTHGARGFLYPIVDPQDITLGGFEVLAVCHPDDDVVNSVIIAQKSKDVHVSGLHSGRAVGGQSARGTVPVVSPPRRFGEMVADMTQKREEFANAEVAF